MPELTNLEKVRLMAGDNTSGSYLLTDDQVSSFIDDRSKLNDSGGTTWVNLHAAAADTAGACAAKVAQDFDFAEDGQRFSRSQKFSNFLARERELRNLAGGFSVPAGTATT